MQLDARAWLRHIAGGRSIIMFFGFQVAYKLLEKPFKKLTE